MDEMRISTNFMKGIIAKTIAKIIKKKFGVAVTVSLNDFFITNDEKTGVAKVHLNVNAEMPSEGITKFMEGV